MAQIRTTPARLRGTRTERLTRERLARNLRALEDEGTFTWLVRDQIPHAWATLEDDVDVFEKKVKVTLRLDESVAKFYRAMGTGYQGRINRILATYAQLKIMKATALEAEMREELPWVFED